MIDAAILAAMVGCSPSNTGTNPQPAPGSTRPSGRYGPNPLLQGDDLLAGSLTGTNTGTAVGVGGTILRTTNGGATRVSQTGGTILRTTDGGMGT